MASQAGSSNLNVNQMSYISVRKNAVVFSVADNVYLSSYVDALSSSVPPNSITHASRISNGRAAVYLYSKEIADEAILCGLHIQETYVEISPLVLPTTRLVLSNVYPEIPNYVITANLSDFCKTVSPVRPIPLGMKGNNCRISCHLEDRFMSLSTQILPYHINFNHAGVNYRIFISTESVKCFSCGEYGHISKHCKKNTSQPDDNQPTDPSPETTHNPLNPPPVFHHGKKLDPKHPWPSKQSKTNIKHTTPARSDSATPVFSNNVSQPLNPSDPTTSNTNDPPSLSPTAPPPPPPASQPPPTSPLPPHSSPHPPPTSPHPATLNTHSPSSPTTATPSTTRSDKPHSSKYIWGTPPSLQRDNSTPLFSEVLSKRKKKHSPPSSTQTVNSSLMPLKSPSPPRKIYKHLETVKDQPTITDPPTLSQALDDSSQMSIDGPSASESDSDIQSVTFVI